MSYNGWMLPDRERARILESFPPTYEVVKASHVTLEIDDETIPQDADIEIVGRIFHDGVEALVVSVDGSTTRPDGRTFHITLSLAEGRASKESNDVLAAFPYEPVPPFPIETRAFVCRGGIYITTPLSKA
jgi:hypothetical protein